jgi:Domain of unknown function (DUF4460)
MLGIQFRLTNKFFVPRTTSVLNANFASKAKQRERRKNFEARWKQGDVGADKADSFPQFSSLLRVLYKKSHPDLLRASHPELAEANDVSMRTLNGILTTLKQYNEYPAQIIQTLPFHLKNPKTGAIEEVDLRIKTAGGDSARSLTASFEDFFLRSSILQIPEQEQKQTNETSLTSAKKSGEYFRWDKDYFPTEPLEQDEDDELDGQTTVYAS